MTRRIWLAMIGAILAFVLMQSTTLAQSTINLQADINSLRSQVSQLRAEVAALSRQQGRSPVPAAPARSKPGAELSDRQLIDRLAILAIEAKDRMNGLETRIQRLESKAK